MDFEDDLIQLPKLDSSQEDEGSEMDERSIDEKSLPSGK